MAEQSSPSPITTPDRGGTGTAFTLPPQPPAPEGFRYAFNRFNAPWEHTFDGIPECFGPYEVRLVPESLAVFLRNQSIIPGTLRYNDVGGMIAEHSIALNGEPTFGVPTTTRPAAELFDAAAVPNYVGLGTGGDVTTRQVVQLHGAARP